MNIKEAENCLTFTTTFNPSVFNAILPCGSIEIIKRNYVKVNNQNLHKSREIEIPEDIDITDVIINGETTILKNNDEKIILKKAKEDKYNIEYAFLYGYFLMNSGLSKNQASKFFKELRGTLEDEK